MKSFIFWLGFCGCPTFFQCPNTSKGSSRGNIVHIQPFTAGHGPDAPLRQVPTVPNPPVQLFSKKTHIDIGLLESTDIAWDSGTQKNINNPAPLESILGMIVELQREIVGDR